ncbi:hypothetical protein BaRGS_00009407 [Batillaria attramentaria]|uniref:Uncharacterized protein n=1 Tax=Batillaria attramentaria TaxID=370345 RepID=A0ABD0LJC8_9CAEN
MHVDLKEQRKGNEKMTSCACESLQLIEGEECRVTCLSRGGKPRTFGRPSISQRKARSELTGRERALKRACQVGLAWTRGPIAARKTNSLACLGISSLDPVKQ